MNEDITFKKGEFGYVEYKSSNPFEFHQIINDFDKAPMQDLQGWLLFPEKFSGKLSCMVCMCPSQWGLGRCSTRVHGAIIGSRICRF